MRQDVILLKPSDNWMNRLTMILGSVEQERLVPILYMAQTRYVKEILTDCLFDKIYNDFINNNLEDEYKEIYEKYVIEMLVYFGASMFIEFNSIQLGNGGVFVHTPDNGQPAPWKEYDRLSKRYKELGYDVANDFYKMMDSNPVEEYKSCNPCNDKGNYIGLPLKISGKRIKEFDKK